MTLLESRVPHSECKSLGKGPLGFNASGIGIYASNPPQTYLTFEDNSDYLIASSKPKYEKPEMFEFWNCTYTPPPYQGKGAVEYFQGYIQSNDGKCITASSLKSQGAHFSKEECAFDDGKSSSVSAVSEGLTSFYRY